MEDLRASDPCIPQLPSIVWNTQEMSKSWLTLWPHWPLVPQCHGPCCMLVELPNNGSQWPFVITPMALPLRLFRSTTPSQIPSSSMSLMQLLLDGPTGPSRKLTCPSPNPLLAFTHLLSRHPLNANRDPGMRDSPCMKHHLCFHRLASASSWSTQTFLSPA